ncbi:hypothetical protein FRC96_05700 [Lujinxingia vulgaris]|uniref:Peroxidase n=1 Tax=Lujinxingia vulgaris TaxID=2600176 RepID=A0A5C6XQK7_9DELT|nr:hypothetical protein [Lujinxingia vulgaris]TXD39765.1 hypothetical protein FRC96_05700 [Lujinxingia vulgaris]
MTELDVDEIQTYILSGLSYLPASLLTLIRFTGDPTSTLQKVSERVSFGLPEKSKGAVTQVAFTAKGLEALGCAHLPVDPLHRPFTEGMTAAARSRALGDIDQNSPSQWRFSDATSHLAIWTFAPTIAHAQAQLKDILGDDTAWSVEHSIATLALPDQREHFGFRDGITSHRLPWPGQGDANGAVTGDFVFGYRDARGQNADGPDLGRVQAHANGTYLVIRQLQQNVHAFWRMWLNAARGDSTLAIWLASKAVGRWPNGMPMNATAPCPMPPASPSLAIDSFDDDPLGHRCPLGAHIRRSNPRDESSHHNNTAQHRIARRGRVYGPAAPSQAFPADLSIEPNELGRCESQERGLLFACLNSDISRQFEFIQQTWLNNPKFRGLHDEIDPITGGGIQSMVTERFTIPARPFRIRVPWASCVKVRGGGYFWMPSRTDLHMLSTLPQNAQSTTRTEHASVREVV